MSLLQRLQARSAEQTSQIYPVDNLLAAAGLSPRLAPNNLRCRVLIIGPQEAAALLVANKDNRTLRPGRVKFYARVMEEGGWRLTHQGIAFSTAGIGIDLQHRLEAIKQSGVTVPMLVVEGLDPKAFDAIDQHERRSMADALRLDKHLIEEAKMLILIMGGASGAQPTIVEVAEVACLISDAASKLRGIGMRKIFSAVPVRSAAVLLCVEKPKAADEIVARYKAMILHHTEKWSPAMHAFGRQVAQGGVSSSSAAGRADLFCRALKALDPSQGSLSKIQLSESSISSASARVRNVLNIPDADIPDWINEGPPKQLAAV